MVHRIYVEKKQEYAANAADILHEIRYFLRIESVKALRVLNRYDVEGISEDLFLKCVDIVFNEPQVDEVYSTLQLAQNSDESKANIIAVEFLPGQFDQRAQSAAECIQLISCEERPNVAYAKIFLLYGDISAKELMQIEKHLINPVEARKANLSEKQTLKTQYPMPKNVQILNGFIQKNKQELSQMRDEFGLAMDDADLLFCQNYFKSENRNPTITEIRMIDTYWSDHCRHTTFGTVLTDIEIEDETINNAFLQYKQLREEIHANKIDKKPITLMDMATIGAKYLKKQGILKNLDESDEINACSVNIKVDVNGNDEDWLLLFKNETHNHPTEIEPFGGAATCIGGAIRDPLANRGYVYQAMRVTGAANPLVPVNQTLKGKLPQRKLVQTAAAGYSSYGNQIGLATGLVDEIYHDGYMAKRMEIGAVVGAVPLDAVRREEPCEGDVVVLIGGATGRDGCGGATGSSKAHKLESLENCGAEVQKGNAPEERKLQRLFRNKDITLLIKRCNDFGAGGVSVAIGELADGLVINLDKVPKKYDGLDGTELAISESQERMAVVIEAKNTDEFIKAAQNENLNACVVAQITKEKRLVMHWNGNVICDISREFLNTNGADKFAKACIEKPQNSDVQTIYPQIANAQKAGKNLQNSLCNLMADLNVCSKKGLAERFDSTIGAGSVLMPFGGITQTSPTQSMVAKLPVLNANTNTCSAMAFGYDPFISTQNPYNGAYYAVVLSVAKLIATGFKTKNMYLTFQEYFERLGTNEKRWGKPVSSLLGALSTQLHYGVASIGGKDSMSGTFEQIDVPPTLVSFAVAHGDANHVISPEFKGENSVVALISPNINKNGLPCEKSQNAVFSAIEQYCEQKLAKSAWALDSAGIAAGIIKMGMGNRIGFTANENVNKIDVLQTQIGGFILEFEDENAYLNAVQILNKQCNNLNENELPALKNIGKTSKKYIFTIENEFADLDIVQNEYEQKLASVFPYYSKDEKPMAGKFAHSSLFDEDARKQLTTTTISAQNTADARKYKGKAYKADEFAKPRVLIPVFPGTNCEYDSAKAMQEAGAVCDIFVINNLTPEGTKQSALALQNKINESQIVFLPGGFSGGDEPEGSAKLINAFFTNPSIKQSVHELLKNRDGLMLGICNGFQALIKLGLVPFGEIVKTDASCPTLTFNTIGRHQSMLVRTRIASNSSPWLSNTKVGDISTVAISHGEGRFVADEKTLERLINNGQIATQYVDLKNEATMDLRFNPNGSMLAIEGILSPDGRVFGKMGHRERAGEHLYKNVPANKANSVFKAGVDYFKL